MPEVLITLTHLITFRTLAVLKQAVFYDLEVQINQVRSEFTASSGVCNGSIPSNRFSFLIKMFNLDKLCKLVLDTYCS